MPANTFYSPVSSYSPVLPWGWSGHVQTVMFGVLGRVGVTKVPGHRYSLRADDGSEVFYDVFEPNISEEEKLAREKKTGTASPITFFAVPGKSGRENRGWPTKACWDGGYYHTLINACNWGGCHLIIDIAYDV